MLTYLIVVSTFLTLFSGPKDPSYITIFPDADTYCCTDQLGQCDTVNFNAQELVLEKKYEYPRRERYIIMKFDVSDIDTLNIDSVKLILRYHSAQNYARRFVVYRLRHLSGWDWYENEVTAEVLQNYADSHGGFTAVNEYVDEVLYPTHSDLILEGINLKVALIKAKREGTPLTLEIFPDWASQSYEYAWYDRESPEPLRPHLIIYRQNPSYIYIDNLQDSTSFDTIIRLRSSIVGIPVRVSGYINPSDVPAGNFAYLTLEDYPWSPGGPEYACLMLPVGENFDTVFVLKTVFHTPGIKRLIPIVSIRPSCTDLPVSTFYPGNSEYTLLKVSSGSPDDIIFVYAAEYSHTACILDSNLNIIWEFSSKPVFESPTSMEVFGNYVYVSDQRNPATAGVLYKINLSGYISDSLPFYGIHSLYLYGDYLYVGYFDTLNAFPLAKIRINSSDSLASPEPIALQGFLSDSGKIITRIIVSHDFMFTSLNIGRDTTVVLRFPLDALDDNFIDSDEYVVIKTERSWNYDYVVTHTSGDCLGIWSFEVSPSLGVDTFYVISVGGGLISKYELKTGGAISPYITELSCRRSFLVSSEDGVLRYHFYNLEEPDTILRKGGVYLSKVYTLRRDTLCPCSGMVGDINGDGSLNAIDIRELSRFLFFGQSLPSNWHIADINWDGVVDPKDLVYLTRVLWHR